MRITIDVAMTYRFPRPNTVFLALEAAKGAGQTVVKEHLDIGRAALSRISGASYASHVDGSSAPGG